MKLLLSQWEMNARVLLYLVYIPRLLYWQWVRLASERRCGLGGRGRLCLVVFETFLFLLIAISTKCIIWCLGFLFTCYCWLSIYLSICISLSFSPCLSVCPPTYLSACLSICLFIHLSHYPSLPSHNTVFHNTQLMVSQIFLWTALALPCILYSM